jgi:hypothetical protein
VESYLEDESIELNDGDKLMFRATWDGRTNNWGKFLCALVPHPKLKPTLDSKTGKKIKNPHTVQGPFDAIPIVICKEGESRVLLQNTLSEWSKLIEELSNGHISVTIKSKTITADVIASPDLKALKLVLNQNEDETKILYKLNLIVKSSTKPEQSDQPQTTSQTRRITQIQQEKQTNTNSRKKLAAISKQILDKLEGITDIDQAVTLLEPIQYPNYLSPNKVPHQICPFCYCTFCTVQYSIWHPRNILFRKRLTLENCLGIDKEKIHFCLLHCFERLTEHLLSLLCKQCKSTCETLISIFEQMTKSEAQNAGFPKHLEVCIMKLLL